MGDIQLTAAAIPQSPPEQPKAGAGRVDGDVERSNEQPPELENTALKPCEVEKFMWEIRRQPAWRKEADRCCDYHDGNQLDAELMERLKERGQPPLITNLIKPAIDTVLGIEAKSRSDWKVRAEDDGITSEDASDALSLKMKHAETESRADRACSDAYAGEIKAGLGWVEVSRETDPFKYPYRVKSIHRREIAWDWRALEADLSDAKYLIRRRWLDLDAAIAMMPEYADLLRQTCGGWAGWDPILAQSTGLQHSYDIERDTQLDRDDWRDIDRQRVCLYEIWYRKWVSGYVMIPPAGQPIEADFNNPRHVAAINAGVVQVQRRTFEKVRLAWYCGPHFLYDVPSPYKHGQFPYVPFFGHREDQTGAPYGLIRAMLSPQDEVNARKSKQLWLLNSRRVVADADAVTDHDKAREQVARPDAYIELNPNRKPTSRFEIQQGGDLASQQFTAMQEAKQEIAESSGIHKSMMGQQSGATSGLAINSLVEQGLNTLAEINDNYRFARRQVGELLFSLLLEDMAGKQIPVEIGDGKAKRVVVLNQVAIDQQTGQPVIDPNTRQPVILNDTRRVRTKIVLDDVPSSPTFRLQMMQMLTEMAKASTPQAQAVMMPDIIEMSDAPNRTQLADRLRQAMGMQDEQAQAEAAKAQAAQAQKVEKMQERMAVLEAALTAAKVRGENAKADQLEAQTAQLGMMPAEYTQYATSENAQ